MKNKILKKGTKVVLNNVHLDEYTPTGCYMPGQMRNLQGKVVTIKHHLEGNTDSYRYSLRECGRFTYTDEMFSLYLPAPKIGGRVPTVPEGTKEEDYEKENI